MRIAVLPFNAAEGTKQAYGRQFASWVGDQLRSATESEVNTVSFLAQVEDEDGPRTGFVNIADGFLGQDQINEMLEQTETELLMDGSLKEEDGAFDLMVRFHKPEQAEPSVEQFRFVRDDIFKVLHTLLKRAADAAGETLPAELAGETLEFGTDNAEAFLAFFEGYDAFNYLQQSQGRPVKEFDSSIGLQALVTSLSMDPDFVAPYEVLVEYGRGLAHYRIGTFDAILEALEKAKELVPEEWRANFGLGEVYQSVGNFAKAAEEYEKAITMAPEEASLYTRLGIAQMSQNMPVNAERNFRKAVDMEGEDKPTMDYLAAVLQQTDRAHEIPALWKGLVEQNPQNAQARVKHAVALFAAGSQDEAEKAFENALETVEDNAIVKRYYAPMLASKGELDRAMDFFEDCLDLAPNDVELLLEYANTLKAANREFEIPRVLNDVLKSNPDANTRAQALAWLIELEQPKRAETVEAANNRMAQNDFEGVVRELKPLRNWLADYWKLWLLLAAAYNRLNQPTEAEDAARRLLELFPGCEPGYAELASALNGQDRHEEAYNFMRFAAMNNPGSLPIHINLALAAKRAGHPDEAKALARQIREAVGPNEEIEKVLAEIEM